MGHVIGGVRGIYDCFEFEAEKLGLTSGQIQGSWSMRWWDAGGGVPAPQLPLCVDAFRAWRVNAGTKTGFMYMEALRVARSLRSLGASRESLGVLRPGHGSVIAQLRLLLGAPGSQCVGSASPRRASQRD